MNKSGPYTPCVCGPVLFIQRASRIPEFPPRITTENYPEPRVSKRISKPSRACKQAERMAKYTRGGYKISIASIYIGYVMVATSYIALGGNIGDRVVNMLWAIAAIGRLPETEVLAVSGFYNTPAVGGPPDQPDYLNAAARIATRLAPPDLLAGLLAIEIGRGRNRRMEQRHGPRPIDLDILLYADQIYQQPHLTIPHPRLHERLFVLLPLNEIAPDAWHPVLGCRIRELLTRILHPGGRGGRRGYKRGVSKMLGIQEWKSMI